MSAEHKAHSETKPHTAAHVVHKKEKKQFETFREWLGRLGIAAGLVGLAAISLGALAAKKFLLFSAGSIAGGGLMIKSGVDSRTGKSKPFFRRRQVGGGGGGHH